MAKAEERLRLIAIQQLLYQRANLIGKCGSSHVVRESQRNCQQTGDAVTECRRVDAPCGDWSEENCFHGGNRKLAIVFAVECLACQPERSCNARTSIAPGATAWSIRRSHARNL